MIVFSRTAAIAASIVGALLVTGTAVVVGNVVIHSRAKGNAAVTTR